jgi:ribosome-binding protein aMBF1 (putative translation factor)
MDKKKWIPNEYCDCCGRNNIEVVKIHTTIAVIHICKKCLSEMADVYLGSEGI